MDRISIFEYKDYKRYLIDWMGRAPNGGRGQRKLLAGAVGCQTPFITHVLSGGYHFSLEQAEACTRWLGLGESEAEFFLLLVIRGRAGTAGLEALASRQLSRRREAETVLKKRLRITGEMTIEDQLIYYGSWKYAAIHMACRVPELQSVEALCRHFGLTLREARPVLEFLTEKRLIQRTASGYRVLKPMMHLGKDSPVLPLHHGQWRMRAMDSHAERSAANLSYSAVVSLSREDYEWARERVSRLIEELVGRIQDSPDEMLAGLCLDFFRV